MIKANKTIFDVYLAMLDSFSEYLSKKYSGVMTDHLDYYKAINVQKIQKMFHTFENLINITQDEISSRCILRSLLDNVTVFCFIYDRKDIQDVVFRHLLYALDGIKSYKESVVNELFVIENKEQSYMKQCNEIVCQLEKKLAIHPYYKLNIKAIQEIINNRNWKYESFKKPKSLSFYDMYVQIGFEKKTARYYQSHLSQFSHGLLFSNVLSADKERMKNVLYESIPIEVRIVNAIMNTFPKDDLINSFLSSNNCMDFLNKGDATYNELVEFVTAIIKERNQVLLI